MILSYYIDDKYLLENFKFFDSITSDAYYVQMAIAWAVSVCLVKFYDETVEYLKTCALDKFTYNKAIQKIQESCRVSEEDKKMLKNMKK